MFIGDWGNFRNNHIGHAVKNNPHIDEISARLALENRQVSAVALLLDEGATIPFIARYRKEQTGSLDEVAVTQIRNQIDRLRELERRRSVILKSLEKNGHLTDERQIQLEAAQTLSELEDLYLPFRPKRRTRATIAREKGLAPLAEMIFQRQGAVPDQEALAFIDPEKDVASVADALQGARDIMAEMINENQAIRSRLRDLFFAKGVLRCQVIKGKEDQGQKYRNYFQWEEPIRTAPAHRILAMRRGEREEILSFTIAPAEDKALDVMRSCIPTSPLPDGQQVDLAVVDSYRRLLSRSLETEMRLRSKERADTESIGVFVENLRALLMAPPLGAKRVMGIDPGYRTGCKLALLDRQGKLVHHDVIYLHRSRSQNAAAAAKLTSLCQTYQIDAVAVGNGTAGKETLAFLKQITWESAPLLVLVDESGASIYSASTVARDEFPDLDLTIRGAVSIGRRLMDPLAELVKIDPKSIGVGQYQHDVDQAALRRALEDTVRSCVNAVGVEVNRASAQLLTYVSGLGSSVAQNIIKHRDREGPFRSREDLMKVKGLGPKAFEQCAGFLRIRQGTNPLDASAVHPESYAVVEKIAQNLDCRITDLMTQPPLRGRIKLSEYVTDSIGLPTLEDIVAELGKPGRDPREPFEFFNFTDDINTIDDLKPGMQLTGIVSNVTAFGAFVDIGVHQDGLVHISEMADTFVKDPADIVTVRQRVNVRILGVDIKRNRIQLSMRAPKSTPHQERRKKAPPKSNRKPKPNKQRPFNNPFQDLLNKN